MEGGTSYTDPGATATDTVAGDLTAQIQVSGTVNTAVVGSYELTYTVTDGFNPTTEIRTVNVVDTTAPAVLITSPLSDAVPAGGTAVVQLQATDVVGVAGVTVNGVAAARISGSAQAGTWRATVPITLPVAAGSALQFDARASDAAGNAGPGMQLVDTDGIPAAMDRGRASGVDQSDRYSSDFNNNITTGTVARNGWTMKVSTAPAAPAVPTMIAGIRATVSGSGTPATISACVGAAKEVRLDVTGETADIACNPATGTITVKAISAAPATPSATGIIELRELLAAGIWQQFNLRTGQAMSVGSPALASRANSAAIEAQLVTVDADGTERVIGSYQLAPDASVDISVTPDGLRQPQLNVRVVRGRVSVTLGGIRRMMQAGERATMSITRERSGRDDSGRR